MSIKLSKILNDEAHHIISSLNFERMKTCVAGTDGLILSIVIGYLDALILSQNSEYNSTIFLSSIISRLPIQEQGLIDQLTLLLSNQADIDSFTNYCRSSESYHALLELGKSLLDHAEVKPVNEHRVMSHRLDYIPRSEGEEDSKPIVATQEELDKLNNPVPEEKKPEIKEKTENDILFNLYDFSKAFNVQFVIYQKEREKPVKYARNELTDALIINLFKVVEDAEQDIYYYSSIYQKNYKEICEKNLNCTREFVDDTENINGNFIPILTLKKVLADLYDYKIPQDNLEKIREAHEDLLKKSGDIWIFSEEYRKLFDEFIPCDNCTKLRTKFCISCGNKLCKECALLSCKQKKCIKCGRTLAPNEEIAISNAT